MKNDLEKLRDDFLAAVKQTGALDELEKLRVEYLGRKGKLAGAMKQIPQLAEDVRKEVGAFANDIKDAIEGAFEETYSAVSQSERNAKQQSEWIDLSAPGERPNIGHLHLTTQTIEDVAQIFKRLGFVRRRHPEIDWDYYAFESLNFPEDHPARDDWETFFIADGEAQMQGEKGKVVLTPHTSNAQVREMEQSGLPIRMISINKTYRRQAGVRHLPMFHQFEGLMIDKGVTVTQLRGVFDFFVKEFFGPDRETRLRPHHFRFTEPSFELDISCGVCRGTGEVGDGKCRICKGGWLELGGAGMVHPNVLRAGGVDPEIYSGFAFGWGVERTMMMRAGINIGDIRVLYKNDLRFLKQF